MNVPSPRDVLAHLDEPMCPKCDLRATRAIAARTAQRHLALVHGLALLNRAWRYGQDSDNDVLKLHDFLHVFHPEVAPDSLAATRAMMRHRPLPNQE